MLNQRTQFSIYIIAAIAGLISFKGFVRGDDTAKQIQNRPELAQEPFALPEFAGASDQEIYELSEAVESQREKLHDLLLQQLKKKALSPLGRAETLSLLSGLKPTPVDITAFIENIDVIAAPHPRDGFEASPRPIGYVSRIALAEIGKPAEEKILTIVGSRQTVVKSEIELPAPKYEASQAEGFAGVLTRINGKDGALTKLRQFEVKANDPIVKKQFQEVMAAVEKGEKPPFKY